jgi:hypothetical protein
VADHIGLAEAVGPDHDVAAQTAVPARSDDIREGPLDLAEIGDA